MDLTKSRNANKMKEIQKKSQEQSAGIVAINISLDEIDENPDNEKAGFDMQDIEGLVEDIKNNGFIGTINVFKKPDGRYEIFSGHRRFRAVKKLKLDTIPCTVSPYPDDFDRGMKLLSSNVHNRVQTPLGWAKNIDYYYNLMKMHKKYNGRLRDNAAEYFRMSPVNIERYHSLLKLIPELQEMANDPEYPYSAFTTAGTLSEEDQHTLYDLIQDEIDKNSSNEENFKGISRTRIQQLINGLKYNPESPVQKDKFNGNYVTNAVTPNVVPASEVREETSKDITGEVDVPAEFTGEEVKDSPSFSHEGDAGDYAAEFSDDADVSAGLVSYEPSESVLADANEHSVSAETKLSAFIPEIERIASGKYEIIDPDMVKRYLKRLRTAIEGIEKRI